MPADIKAPGPAPLMIVLDNFAFGEEKRGSGVVVITPSRGGTPVMIHRVLAILRRYDPGLLVAVVASVLTVFVADVLLLERKHDVFRGGFLQAHPIVGVFPHRPAAPAAPLAPVPEHVNEGGAPLPELRPDGSRAGHAMVPSSVRPLGARIAVERWDVAALSLEI